MGIELVSKRGAIGRSFLATSFLERAEEAFGSRGRAAGKRLARAGGVEWIDVTEGRVRASVSSGGASSRSGAVADGTSALSEPELSLGPWRPHDREAFLARAAANPSEVMAVLAGTYAREHEEALEAEGLPLLPGDIAQLSYGCTCLAWPAVCEHVYALVYASTEHFDAHPGDYLGLLGVDVERIDLADGAAAEAETSVGPHPPDPAASGPREVHEPAPRARFSPAAVDAALLHDMVSPEVAAVLAAFYAEARETEPPLAPMTEGETE